jgi:hypothetical protein
MDCAPVFVLKKVSNIVLQDGTQVMNDEIVLNEATLIDSVLAEIADGTSLNGFTETSGSHPYRLQS